MSKSSASKGRWEWRRVGVTLALLFGYFLLSLLASLCTKEGGTDAQHWVRYFIISNILGITSTALLMGVYSRMQVNLAMVLATSGTFALVQLTFWLLYHSSLTWLQGGGIVLVGLGTVLAACTGKAPASAEPVLVVQEEIS